MNVCMALHTVAVIHEGVSIDEISGSRASQRWKEIPLSRLGPHHVPLSRVLLLRLSYRDHLWLEREIKTVANVTARDIREFLQLAAEVPILPEVTTYPLEDANQALVELRRGGVRGAKVLVLG